MVGSTIDRLYPVFQTSGSFTDIEQYFNYITEQAKTLVSARYGCLAPFDKMTREFYYFKGCEEIKNAGTNYQRIKPGKGIIGWIAKHLQPVRLANARADQRFDKEVDDFGNTRVKSIMAVPMVSSNELIGVLKVANLTNRKNKKAFTLRDQKLLTILATHAALFIDNFRLVEENLSQAKLSDLGHSIASDACNKKHNYVRIKTQVIEDSGVQISVSDNGRGISKANL